MYVFCWIIPSVIHRMFLAVNYIWMWCDSNFFLCVSTVIRKQNTLVCQFASPLDVNMHDKPEVSHYTCGVSLSLIEKPLRFYSSCAFGKQFNGASLDQIQTEQLDTSCVIAGFFLGVGVVFQRICPCWKPFATFWNFIVFEEFFTKRNRPPYLEAMSDCYLVSWLKLLERLS